ncbi:MAG: hypothetical protein FWF51_05780 [Chitinivibrionia bacterium]|nr:hypothetical protein [Chitinivibrionia bacterium]
MKVRFLKFVIIMSLICCGACFGQNVIRAESSEGLFVVIEGKMLPEDKRWDWINTGWNKPKNCDEPKYNPKSVVWSANKNADYTDSVYFSLTQPIPANSSLTVTYEIKSDKGVVDFVGNQLLTNNNREARAYFSDKKGELLFGERNRIGIPIRIIDHGDNRGDANFTITLTEFRAIPQGSVKPILSQPVTFRILTDDPDEYNAPPVNFIQNRVMEFYDFVAQKSQEVGELKVEDGDIYIGNLNNPEADNKYMCYMRHFDISFEITEIFDKAGNNIALNCFEIDKGKIKTTENYKIDYENPDEQEIRFKVKTIARRKGNGEIENSDTTIVVRISPWNDNKFSPQEDREYFNKYEKICIIDVLQNDIHDIDCPKEANRHLLIGLTNRELISDVALNADGVLSDILQAQEITTDIGAKATIENGKIKYDVSSLNIEKLPTSTDVFYYTALDTALYGYDTDAWVKSVKVTVNIVSVDLPPKPFGNSFYYDTDGNGIVDEIVIPFDKEVEKLDEILFDVKFAGVENYVVYVEYAIDENGDEDRKKIVIDLGNNAAAQDSTSGVMQVTLTYLNDEYRILNDGDFYRDIIYPRDGAAPVIVRRAKIIKSVLDGVNDVLVVYLSERFDIDITNGNLPFKFMKTEDKTFYDIRFDAVEVNGNECVLVVNSEDNAKISKGDSVFINSAAAIKIKDIANGNEQIAQDNKKAIIDQDIVAEILAAVYFDVDEIKDGYADLIKINVGVEIDLEIAQMLSAALEPDLPRGFRIIEPIVLSDDKKGFSLKVEEQAKREADGGKRKDNLPKTNADEKADVIKLRENITFGDITIKAKETRIEDSIAPVIWHAIYAVSDTNNRILDVVFSEPVKVTRNGNPYLFWDVFPEPGQEFTMTFGDENPENLQNENNILRYRVKSTSIPYPLENDSIFLLDGEYISDFFDNAQNLTARAPIILDGEYPNIFDLYVVPQPLVLSKTGNRFEPKELDDGLINYYSISRDKIKGVAIILHAQGPISYLEKQRGFFRIIDNTGNAVTDNIDMEFSEIGAGKFAFAGVWDGKNRAGRNVGSGTYLAVVQAEIKFDGNKGFNVYTFKKVVGVSVK